MGQKILNTTKYGLAAAITTVGFGILTYWLTTEIAGDSIVFAYLLNVAYIFICLLVDSIIYAKMESKTFLLTKNNYKRYKYAYFDSYISSKTMIYTYYIFVLVAGQLHYFDASILSGEFGDYLESIKYCLVIVMAFDKLIDHVFKDIKRINRISAKFKSYESGEQERID